MYVRKTGEFKFSNMRTVYPCNNMEIPHTLRNNVIVHVFVVDKYVEIILLLVRNDQIIIDS